MKSILALFAAALMLTSCNSDDDRSPSPDTNAKNELRLNNLQVGQSNRFIAFRATCAAPAFFEYTGDTLIAEIIAMNGGLAIRESFTPGSTNNPNTEAVSYPVVKKDGYLLLPDRSISQLFFFFGNDTLPVQKPNSITLQQGSCYLEYQSGEPFIGEEVALISPLVVGDRQYFDKRVVSCVPPFMNLDAYIVYDSKQLFISMTLADTFEDVLVNGFIMIPNE